MADERWERFSKLLKKIFELDRSDLDFGIYRVMNLRKAEIEDFLTRRVPDMVREILAPFARDSRDKLRAELEEIERGAAQFGADPAALPEDNPMGLRYRALQRQLAEGADLAALETDVYAALYSFFSRYYEEGDFISKRRYKEGVYAIPYEGEEVKLYWANQDQYYIKTSENFKDYAFVSGGITVRFCLTDATTEQNNNKEDQDSKRTFLLFPEDEARWPGLKTFSYDPEAREVVIRFIYDIPPDRKKKYDEENYAAIARWLLSLRRTELDHLLAPAPGGRAAPLEKHLKGYAAKNTFDYFIHKDLRGFLERELDFFLKNEVMRLEDLDTANEARAETYLAKLRAVKRVGRVIVDFLAQIEDFQKKLWLKQKFVVETRWCLTLDRIDRAFWPEVAANRAQREEWAALYAIDEAEGWSEPPSLEFLERNQNLIVDTRHFPDAFQQAVLERIPDLDGQTDGVLLNADNIHALRLLRRRYEGQVKAIHIDPPYNTDTSGFLYKNNYRHSSWMSMMDERIQAALPLLARDGSFVCHIDENEYENLHYLFQGRGLYDLGTVVWDKRNPMTGGAGIALQHEYMTWFSPDNITVNLSSDHAEMLLEKAAQLIARHGGVDERVRAEYSRWVASNPELSGGDRAYRFLTDDGRIYQSVSLRAPEPRENPKFHQPLLHPVTKKPCPVPPNGFSRTPETLAAMGERGELIFGEDETIQPRYKMFLTNATKKQLTSVICDAVKGTSDLHKLGLKFPYCHSVSFYHTILSSAAPGGEDLVLDFFAGSGTTGHAVIDDNRARGNHKRYILAEMGEYFHKVTLPRIQKAVYAADWKDGRPRDRGTGCSQIIKYMRLESYEDALSNIELPERADQYASLLGEENLIRYLVDLEGRGGLLNTRAFSDPFAYAMRITEKNECRVRNVDLCETFNYLLGLRVDRQSAVARFLGRPARDPAYEGALELVRDPGGPYAFRRIEGTLPDGRRALVIWRTVTRDAAASSAALDAYFAAECAPARRRGLDVVFVNGDSSLEALRGGEAWTVRVIETEFQKRMFEEA